MYKAMTKEGVVHYAPFTDPKRAFKFILGGNARFTLRSKTTSVRYTYRVRKSSDGRIYFARLLTNPGHYTYLGYIREGQLRLSGKSKMTRDSLPVKALSWTLAHLQGGRIPPTLEIWHEGHCGRCGRALTVPTSIASGFGPECITKVHHHD